MAAELYIQGDGSFGYDIVGEASYQRALDHICGGKCEDGHALEVAAVLIEEPDNPVDPNAIRQPADNQGEPLLGALSSTT